MSEVTLYFAGLARDCADTLENNLLRILECCDHQVVNDYEIWVAENDSEDATRDILQEYKRDHSEINLCLFENLDDDYPVREERIAFLREKLFENVKKSHSIVGHSPVTPLYVPIDLDSEIAQSIDPAQFINESLRVATSDTDAIFPASKPYYYDIYALRSRGWVQLDCWAAIKKYRRYFGSFIPNYVFVYRNQKSIEEIKCRGRIPVQSAFGGVGIYDLSSVSGASYKNGGQYSRKICEHVLFNQYINSKQISDEFVVRAPKEHVTYKCLSTSGKVRFALSLFYNDLNNLVQSIL
jgi:hypothetical protein